ncbi:MAG: RHS repeat-associated core domain-containing protein, partial [Chitinispirillaceae bacterium]|nr:RHS repeat-associated core domain-containing protein [Chitinispirillaceae bacterium]
KPFMVCGFLGVFWNLSYGPEDHLGSTRMVLDENGTVKEALMYQPYGTVSDVQGISGSRTDPLRQKFTTKEFDEEGDENGAPGIGAYYFGARFYDPELGIWFSTDPAGQFASAYAYAGNGANPVIMADEDGNFIFSLFLGPLGAVIDAACWSAAIDAAVQGVRIAVGAQDKFNFAELGGAAIGGAVGGVSAVFAPGFAGVSNLGLRYGAKALYAAGTGAISSGAGMLGTDLMDNGRIDYSGKQYLQGMGMAALTAGALSLGSSAYDYATWDKYNKYGDAFKAELLADKYGMDVKVKDLPKDRMGQFISGKNYIEIDPVALQDWRLANSVISHEMVHVADYAAKRPVLPPDVSFRDYSEKNAYLNTMQTAKKFHLPGRDYTKFYNNFSQYNQVMGEFGYTGLVPKYTMWQAIFNVF